MKKPIGQSEVVQLAAKFATEAHGDQKRKDGVTPYIVHPGRVAARMTMHPIVYNERHQPFAMLTGAEMVAVAWMHDVIEDTKIGLVEMEKAFGTRITNGVAHLTGMKPMPGVNRADRKRHDIANVAASAREIRIIKLLDRIDNLTDMVRESMLPRFDWEFAELYVRESVYLANVIGVTDPDLNNELIALTKQLIP